ncbi:alpha/beta hydrolase [Actinomycetospora endophytica]|uniref:Alpha/beta hydrolase n=1 Tax=Actinomycetospora endophytica TaxID=2291215 RepID=A0ABS8PEM7_9PSEU|nr:alpha/beta hydrolase [Actinomycetospora endophytica]MCD2196609.1 alpha/beta hydrolase [Actinomycetospora endophytica]
MTTADGLPGRRAWRGPATRTRGGPRAAALAALAGGAGAALVATAGFRPLTRRWPAAIGASLLAAFATELPRPTAVLTAGVALSAARRGASRTIPGRVGLGLAGAAVAAILTLDRRARTTDQILSEALSSAFGSRAPAPEAPAWLSPRAITAPRRFRAAGAGDVAYGPHGRENLLDVWRHPDLPRDAGAPVLVEIHGGAWSSGRKEGEANPLMAHLVERGWVCVAVNYRLGPGSRWPAMIDDVRAALRWVHAHIGEHGGDPDFVAVTGGSAGAHLAALAALTGRDDDGTRVDAAVTLYGIYDLTQDDGSGTLDLLLAETMMPGTLTNDGAVWIDASPAHRVHPGAPPFFVLHGTGDAIVVPEQSRGFVRGLREVSATPVAYAELPHAQHGFDALPTPRTLLVVRAVEAFLIAVLGRKPERPGGL